MTMPPKMSVGIIGAGGVGTALAIWLSRAGHAVSLGSRDPDAKLEALLHAGWKENEVEITSIEKVARQANLLILAVPDSDIKKVARQVHDITDSSTILAHCSGVLTSSVLTNPNAPSQPVCSLHPLNTFPNLTAAIDLGSNSQHGTTLVSEGDQDAVDLLQGLFSEAGFRCVVISAESKPLYHAASVIVCNYLTVLMESGLRTAEEAGLERDQFWTAIQPLISATLNNVVQRQSLSGPIARGDLSTIETHLHHLKDAPQDLLSIYQVMGLAATRLAEQQGQINTTQSAQLLELLQDESQDTHTGP